MSWIGRFNDKIGGTSVGHRVTGLRKAGEMLLMLVPPEGQFMHRLDTVSTPESLKIAENESLIKLTGVHTHLECLVILGLISPRSHYQAGSVAYVVFVG